MNRPTTLRTTLVTCFALLVPVTAWGQVPVAEEPAKAPASKAAQPKAPAAQPAAAEKDKAAETPAGEKATPEQSDAAKPSAKPSGEPAEGASLPETAESAVGVGPTPGLGPSVPAQPEKKSDKKVSEPRVIDISTKEEKEKAKEEPPEEPPEPKIDPETLPFTYHMRHVDLVLGHRLAGTLNDGLEPFMEEPMFLDTFVRGGGALQLTDRVSLGIHGEIGGGQTSAYVRDLPSKLSKVHLTVGVEGRYHFWNRMYAYGRVAPGLEIVNASLEVPESGDEFANQEKIGSPAFQIDGAVGAAIRIAGSSNGRKRSARFWGFVEGGYRVSTSHDLELTVDENGPSRTVPLDLDPINLSGGFGAAGVMLTF